MSGELVQPSYEQVEALNRLEKEIDVRIKRLERELSMLRKQRRILLSVVMGKESDE